MYPNKKGTNRKGEMSDMATTIFTLGGILLTALLYTFMGTIADIAMDASFTIMNDILRPAQEGALSWLGSFNFLSGGMPEGANVLQKVFYTSGQFGLMNWIYGLSWLVFGLCLLGQIAKLYQRPGGRTPTVGSIIVRSLFYAALLAVCYPLLDRLLSIFTNMISSITNAVFSMMDAGSQLEGNHHMLNNQDEAAYFVMFCILAFGLASTTISAMITYIERYISTAVYTYLAPLCFAMAVNDETKDSFKKWVTGFIGQLAGLVLSMLFIGMAYYSLSSVTGSASAIPGPLGQQTSFGAQVMAIVVATVFMSMAKNAEKFFNMFGFSTMSYGDAARSFAQGLGNAMRVGRVMSNIGKTAASMGQTFVNERKEADKKPFTIDKNGEIKAELGSSKERRNEAKRLNDMRKATSDAVSQAKSETRSNGELKSAAAKLDSAKTELENSEKMRAEGMHDADRILKDKSLSDNDKKALLYDGGEVSAEAAAKYNDGNMHVNKEDTALARAKGFDNGFIGGTQEKQDGLSARADKEISVGNTARALEQAKERKSVAEGNYNKAVGAAEAAQNRYETAKQNAEGLSAHVAAVENAKPVSEAKAAYDNAARRYAQAAENTQKAQADLVEAEQKHGVDSEAYRIQSEKYEEAAARQNKLQDVMDDAEMKYERAYGQEAEHQAEVASERLFAAQQHEAKMKDELDTATEGYNNALREHANAEKALSSDENSFKSYASVEEDGLSAAYSDYNKHAHQSLENLSNTLNGHPVNGEAFKALLGGAADNYDFGYGRAEYATDSQGNIYLQATGISDNGNTRTFNALVAQVSENIPADSQLISLSPGDKLGQPLGYIQSSPQSYEAGVTPFCVSTEKPSSAGMWQVSSNVNLAEGQSAYEELMKQNSDLVNSGGASALFNMYENSQSQPSAAPSISVASHSQDVSEPSGSRPKAEAPAQPNPVYDLSNINPDELEDIDLELYDDDDETY